MAILGTDPLEENYLALAVSILANSPPEHAFNLLTNKFRKDITEADVRDMVQLKAKLTYQQIGEIYGMKKEAVHKRIRNYRAKQVRKENAG